MAHQRQRRAALLNQRAQVADAALPDWMERVMAERHRAATQIPSPDRSQSGVQRTRALHTSAAEASDNDSEDDVGSLRLKKLMAMVVLGVFGRRAYTVLDEFHWQLTKQRRARDEAVVSVGGGMSLQEMHRSWALVRRALRQYVQRYKMRKYSPPIDLVRRFLKHMRRMKTVVAAVGRFRRAVVVAQRSVRVFLISRAARTTLLTAQWVSRECEMLGVPHPMSRVKGLLRRGRQEACHHSSPMLLSAQPVSATYFGVKPLTVTIRPPCSAQMLTIDYTPAGGSSLEERAATIAACVTDCIRKRLREVQRYEHRKRFYDAQFANYTALAAKHVDVEPPKEPKRPMKRELFLDEMVLLSLIRRAQARGVDGEAAVAADPKSPSPQQSSEPSSAMLKTDNASVRFKEPAALRDKTAGDDNSIDTTSTATGSGRARRVTRKPSEVTLPPESRRQSVRRSVVGSMSDRRQSSSVRFGSLGSAASASPRRGRGMSSSLTFGRPEDSVCWEDGELRDELALSTSQRRRRSSTPRKAVPPAPPKPRSDSFYALLLKKDDVDAMRTFLAHDDRTGQKITASYADTRRPSHPIAASSRALKAQQQLEVARSLEATFETPLVKQKGIAVSDPAAPMPEGWRQISLRTLDAPFPPAAIRVGGSGPPLSTSGGVKLPAPPKTARPSPASRLSTAATLDPTEKIVVRQTLTPRGARLPVVTGALAGLPVSKTQQTKCLFIERHAAPRAVAPSPTVQFLVDLAVAHDEAMRPKIRSS